VFKKEKKTGCESCEEKELEKNCESCEVKDPVAESQEPEIVEEIELSEEEKLSARVVELEGELAAAKDGFLRKIAEYENIKKRIEREKEDFIKFASEKLVVKVLEIQDNLVRAVEASKQSGDFDSLCKGVEMIAGQFEKVLGGEGVTKIEAIGQKFDPYKHHAVMSEASSEHEEDTIILELQTGYEMKGKVIRPSMVKVVKN